MISIIRQAKNDYYEASDSVLIIFCVVMLFSENFTVTAQWCRFGEYEGACDSTLQIGHLFGPNKDQRDFYRKGFKLTLC